MKNQNEVATGSMGGEDRANMMNSVHGAVPLCGGGSTSATCNILELTSDEMIAGGGELELNESNNVKGNARQGLQPGVYKLPRAAGVEVTTHVMVMKAMSTHSPLLLLILEGDTWVLPSGTARIGELPFAAGMRGLMEQSGLFADRGKIRRFHEIGKGDVPNYIHLASVLWEHTRMPDSGSQLYEPPAVAGWRQQHKGEEIDFTRAPARFTAQAMKWIS